MLRSLAKTAVATVVCAARADGWVGRCFGASPNRLILGFHRVTRQPVDVERWLPGMAVSVPTLERQLDTVARRFRFAPLGEVVESHSPEPLAAVTFDDGYADVHENAFPLLRRKGIPSAVFVVTSLAGTAELLLHDRLYLGLARDLALPGGVDRLDRWVRRHRVRPWAAAPSQLHEVLSALLRAAPQIALLQLAQELEGLHPPCDDARAELRLADWDALREMSREGVTIGSHASTHALLPLEKGAAVREDLKASREALQREIGQDAIHLAYPGGSCDTGTLAAVAEAGFRFAYTICSHRDARRPSLTIPRRMLWEGSCLDSRRKFSDAVFSCQVHGVFDLASPCREAHRFVN